MFAKYATISSHIVKTNFRSRDQGPFEDKLSYTVYQLELEWVPGSTRVLASPCENHG